MRWAVTDLATCMASGRLTGSAPRLPRRSHRSRAAHREGIVRPRRPDTRNIPVLVGAALVGWTACDADGDSTSGEAPVTARDALAAELGAIICGGASSCCASFAYDAPGEACRTSMRNAVMISIIEAEDEGRELLPDRIDGCLYVFEDAIATAPSCDALPAPAELLLRCPDLFTPGEQAVERAGALPPCPHDEDTCGYPASGPRCPGGDCWSLVFENVCR